MHGKFTPREMMDRQLEDDRDSARFGGHDDGYLRHRQALLQMTLCANIVLHQLEQIARDANENFRLLGEAFARIEDALRERGDDRP